MSDEADAQTAALEAYRNDNRPAGYNASFRAGWDAGRDWQSKQAQPASSNEVTAAAERLLDDAYGLGINEQRTQDIQTLARAVLEDGQEATRLRVALQNIYLNVKHNRRIDGPDAWYFEMIERICRAALSTPGAPESGGE